MAIILKNALNNKLLIISNNIIIKSLNTNRVKIKWIDFGSLANLEDLFKLAFGIVSFVQIIKKNILSRPSLTLGDITIDKVKKFWTVHVAIDRSK